MDEPADGRTELCCVVLSLFFSFVASWIWRIKKGEISSFLETVSQSPGVSAHRDMNGLLCEA